MHIALWFMLSLVHAGVITSPPTVEACAPALAGRELAHSLEQELKFFRQSLKAIQVLDEDKFERWKSEHPTARISIAPVAAFRGALFSLRYPALLDHARRLAELLSVFGDKPQIVNLQHRLIELRDHLSDYAAVDEMRKHVVIDGIYDDELALWFEPGPRVEFTDRVKGRVVTSYRELIKWMLAQSWMSFEDKLSTVDIMLASAAEAWPKHEVLRAQLKDSLLFNLSRLNTNVSVTEPVNILLRVLQIARIERTELNVVSQLAPSLENALQFSVLPLAKKVRDLELMSELPRAPALLKAEAKVRADELHELITRLLPAQ